MLNKPDTQVKTWENILPDLGHHQMSQGSATTYNRKLDKCVVDVQTTDKNGTVEFVMDGYEQSSILWCSTRYPTKVVPDFQRVCMDSNNKRMDPKEADKQYRRITS